MALTDFGIAQTPTANLLTQPGQNIGTVTYMAPELFDGTMASAQSDIYSLGIVAYECLTGRPPFHAEIAVAVAAMHATKTPAPLPPHVPVALRRIVERAMAKRPERRYASAADLAKAIEAAAAPPSVGRSPSPGPTMRDPRVVGGPDARGARPAAPAHPREPGPTRIAVPERRSRLRWLIALLAVAATGSAGAAAVQIYREPEDKPGHVVPAEVRAFAPNWPLDGCTEDNPPGQDQQKRWRCPIEESTSTWLYLIRYEPGGYRDSKRAKNDGMKTTVGAVRLKRGTAVAPGGASGFYREYEVDIGPTKPDWQDEIWFDNYPVQEPSLALLLRTPRTPNTRAAFDRLRRLWEEAGYSRPA